MGEKKRASRDKKKYSNHCVVRKKKSATITPFKLNGRSLSQCVHLQLIKNCTKYFFVHQTSCSTIKKGSAFSVEYPQEQDGL